MFDKRLMEICPQSKKYIAGNVIFQWLELCLNTIMIMTAACTAQKLYENAWTANDLYKAALIIALTVILRIATARMAVYMSYMASRTVKQILREKIYRKMLALGSSRTDYAGAAELVQETSEGVDQLESYFGQYVPQFFYALIAPLFLFFLFGIAGSWKTALILLICVPLIPASIVMVQKFAKKLLAKYWGQYTQLGSTFLENLQGMTALKIYQADEHQNRLMNEESEQFRTITMKVLTMQLNSVTIMDFFAYGGAALGIAAALSELNASRISLFSCIFMILLSADFFLPMRRLGSYFHVAMNGLAASDRIFTFLGAPQSEERTEEVYGTAVSLKNVHFSYDESREVLHDISMRIDQGELVAVVGESGSGKSTAAALMTGRLFPQEGTVAIDGISVQKIREDSLMKAVTYVGAHSRFFRGTLRENLKMADENADDQKLTAVMKQCRLDDLLNQKEGLDFILKENASNLSGGQKQRLALARAILHDSPVYIFDEATSNIDMESEEIIRQEILKLRHVKTVILITHRLANAVSADRIYCLEKGSVKEEGTHASLMAKDGIYARMYRTQQELENYAKEGEHHA